MTRSKAHELIRFLIVEDDEDLKGMLKALFATFGFTVDTARNGKEALDLVYKRDYTAVLTDIKMPVMDGVELLKKIRERDKYSPCVLVTSGFTEYPPDLLFKLGANGFLAKPFGAVSIKDALSRSLLAKEDLWKKSEIISSEFKVGLKFPSYESMISSGDVRFGNGGFFVKQSMPTIPLHSRVSFSIAFESGSPFQRIEGTGIVQYARTVESERGQKGLGIEITYLSDSCREKLCRWIREQAYVEFIP